MRVMQYQEYRESGNAKRPAVSTVGTVAILTLVILIGCFILRSSLNERARSDSDKHLLQSSGSRSIIR
ncbi:hypothetical protein BOTBODRAFT_35809 [Botryobasidium botryosum FD-172 SS1]|uniref:Uncharacterized protein n=1 Tax=Botryobasidium botryosum (strain FD-172 SS1) TaxID=930990 RepID=A0A067MG75_BOTB1|nr:hypothetical protein BOTBODRAFT_35809 [Botryobasidium botryosum FD-172 SS1]